MPIGKGVRERDRRKKGWARGRDERRGRKRKEERGRIGRRDYLSGRDRERREERGMDTIEGMFSRQ